MLLYTGEIREQWDSRLHSLCHLSSDSSPSKPMFACLRVSVCVLGSSTQTFFCATSMTWCLSAECRISTDRNLKQKRCVPYSWSSQISRTPGFHRVSLLRCHQVIKLIKAENMVVFIRFSVHSVTVAWRVRMWVSACYTVQAFRKKA